MSKENGFTPIRRGIWEHVRDGRLSLQDVAVYQYIISQADTRTGIWKGSAGALAGELGMRSARAGRHVLDRLERGDYIRRFAKSGERFCYPILVHKFPVTQGQQEGEVVDALSSSFRDGCLEISYFPRQVKGEVRGEVKGEVSASQRRSENREETQPAKKAPPAAAPNPEDSVWKFLRINPCGPSSFRSLLESGWASRHGKRASVLIGDTVDAWEAAEGEKLPRVPQLFGALANLRQAEKQEAPKETSKPIRVLTPEDIPA